MMDLHKIANERGYGTGKKARDIAAARHNRRDHIPPRKDMAELIVQHVPEALVASFGNDDTDGQDYHLNAHGEGLFTGSTAGKDARAIAALWNAYRDGDLMWVGG